MAETKDNFKNRVESVVSQIPLGKVMTYGQIAAICGSPRAARIVGGIAHWGDKSLPWQRVVKVDGALAEGFPGGVTGHRSVLEPENIHFIGDKVDMKRHRWSTKW
ncbi:MAG: MGMT family protein [Candidatus Saccharimonadales bacterium]